MRHQSDKVVLSAAAIAVSLCASVPAQQPPATFRSGVNVIVVPVSVTDRNRPVPGLAASDFKLSDNGVAQDVTSATVESLPVDVTLVLDTSGSVKGSAFDRLKANVTEIAESMPTNDRVRLVTFATDASDVFGLQPGGAPLPVERIEAGGATSFYNALAAALMAFPYTDRPQLIFGFSDGLDTMSFLDAQQVASLAGRSGASLYLALVSQPVSQRSLGAYGGGPNRRLLRDAAARTGGALYEKSPGMALAALFRQVLDDFRASYVLSYTPRGVAAGGWHDVVVRVKNASWIVRARKGYDGG